jgi:NAD(P)-dependent dehydrogenase (short-subunit alcohol dehydrogenase family)
VQLRQLLIDAVSVFAQQLKPFGLVAGTVAYQPSELANRGVWHPRGPEFHAVRQPLDIPRAVDAPAGTVTTYRTRQQSFTLVQPQGVHAQPGKLRDLPNAQVRVHHASTVTVDLDHGLASSVHSMTHPTFGAQSTAEDVLSGIDLTGKTAVVTGGYSGLGLATTRALAAAGARVVVPARRPDIAQRVLAEVPGVDIGQLNLADPGSVRTFAERLLHAHPTIDIMVMSAGIMACPETRVGPGWEAQFAINHLGHYALANLLWPAFTAADTARIVAVTSGRNPVWRIRWDDVQFSRSYDKWEAYAQSKLANIMFAHHLDQLGRPHGARAFSVNPGWVLTALQRHLTVPEMVAAGWIDANGVPARGLFKTVEQGAATQVWAATSPTLDGHGGEYCADCHVSESNPVDSSEAARLWALSAELTGLDLISQT